MRQQTQIAGGPPSENDELSLSADGSSAGATPPRQSSPAAEATRNSEASTGDGAGADGDVTRGDAGAAPGAGAATTTSDSGGDVTDSAQGRGYDADSVRVGIVTAESGGEESLEAVGFEGIAIGDPERNWRALIDAANERGGLHGHVIEPVFHLINIAEQDPATELEAACARFTQDTPVAVVLSDIVPVRSFVDCLDREGMPVLFSVGRLDEQTLSEVPRTVVTGPNGSEMARGYADGLARAGFFEGPVTDPAVVGLIRVDTAEFERMAENHLEPALARHGVEIAREVVISPFTQSGGYATTSSQLSNAVLQFRSAGVNRVLFLTINAAEPTVFIKAAESQEYYPVYGFTSEHSPHDMEALVSARSLQGAMATGWNPYTDVDPNHDPGGGHARQRCLTTLHDAGITFPDRSSEGIAVDECDKLELVKTAADQAGSLEPGPLVRGVEALDSSYRSPHLLAMRYGPGDRAGASHYRIVAKVPGCDCFGYTSRLQAFPPTT